MKKFIKMIYNSHKFFVKETPSYVGHWSYEYYTKWYDPMSVYYGGYILSNKQKLYYPITYIKFMWYCILYWIKNN